MIHPDTELRKISPTVGYGVFATKLIPRGAITWVRDAFDLFVAKADVEKLHPDFQTLIDTYAFQDPNGDSLLCWDFGRFLNHSCDPTCVCLGLVCDIAARDIFPGEQLTCDYGLLNGEETFQCECGSKQCRRRADVKSFISGAAALDALVLELVPLIGAQPQVLRQYMLPGEGLRLDRILGGIEGVPSCLENLPNHGEAPSVSGELR